MIYSNSQRKQTVKRSSVLGKIFSECLVLATFTSHRSRCLFTAARNLLTLQTSNELNKKLGSCPFISLNICRKRKMHTKYQILGSQGDDHKDFSLSGCDTVRKFLINSIKFDNIHI
jgi:hypothetical protein